MDATTQAPKRKVYAYVDGFNLYHRLLEGHQKRKWLNLQALIQSRFPNDEVAKIRFFTAPVDDWHKNSDKRKRQDVYWRVLRDTGVEIELGRIEKRERQCKAAACGKYLSFSHPTEKMSDVSMALRIVTDAIDHSPGVVCIVTADTDVLPALHMLNARNLRSQRFVLLPGGDKDQYYSRLENFGGIARIDQILGEQVEYFQFPDPYVTKTGLKITKPASW